MNCLTIAGTIFGPAPGEPTAPASGGGVGSAGSSFGAPSAGAFPQLAAAMAPPPPDAAQGSPGAGPGAGAAPPPPPHVLGAAAPCSALVHMNHMTVPLMHDILPSCINVLHLPDFCACKVL